MGFYLNKSRFKMFNKLTIFLIFLAVFAAFVSVNFTEASDADHDDLPDNIIWDDYMADQPAAGDAGFSSSRRRTGFRSYRSQNSNQNTNQDSGSSSRRRRRRMPYRNSGK